MKSEVPRVWFGFPNEIERIELGEMDYTVGICPEYLDSPLPAELFTYHEMALSEDYDIETEVFFRRGNWRITQKQAEVSTWQGGRQMDGIYALADPSSAITALNMNDD